MNPLTLEHISVRFGGLRAVQDVSFEMQRGERRALIGPNGAGKTTLFNLIAGQLRPASGRVLMFGQDVTRLPPHRRAALGLARTFQITNLFPNLSVEENLLVALQALRPMKMVTHRRLSSYHELVAEAERMLRTWHLWERRTVLTRELSYGDQRELEILMALAGRPRLLLLDEPTAGLSAAETALVQRIISELPRDISIVMIEHDLDVALAVADRVTVLHGGVILVDGTPDEIRRDQRVAEIYVGADLLINEAPVAVSL